MIIKSLFFNTLPIIMGEYKIRRVAWDVSHSEFAVRDHYYFSRLINIALKNGIIIEEIDSISDIDNYDVLVINYPEDHFSNTETEKILSFVKKGGITIVLAYYENKDDSARAANTISKEFGVKFNEDSVTSKYFDENEYIVLTDRISRFKDGVRRILIPCPCSVEGGESFVFEAEKGIPLFTLTKIGYGMGIFGGSCSFWDNHSIIREDNEKFAINLLYGKY